MNELDEPDLHKPTMIIDGKRYYVKEINEYNEGVELVVEQLAKLVGINCAHYGIIEKHGKNYYLSEEIDGFINSEMFTEYSKNIKSILDYISSNYPEQAAIIIDQIIKLFLFDILILNGDRNSHNWGFTSENGKIKVWILDNEYAFYGHEKVKLSFDEDRYNLNVGIDNKVISQNIKELLYLLDTSDEIYTDMFLEMLDILNPNSIISIFKEVEDNYNIKIHKKDKLISNYILNYNIISNLFHLSRLKIN